MRRLFSLAVALVLIAPVAAIASPSMKTLGRTSQPIGHLWLCQQMPQECSVKSTTTEAPILTKKRWSQLVAANVGANLTIEPLTDQEFYGVEEHWTYPVSYGDCEDYVLMKRKTLMDQGWPASSLLITVVKRENGEGHAVLTVRTDRGDFILDNLESKIVRWTKTPYRYLKRQSVYHSGHWADISDDRNQVAGF